MKLLRTSLKHRPLVVRKREGLVVFRSSQIHETSRTSSVTGQDLLDLFNRLGVPQDLVDGMKGDDLGIYKRNWHVCVCG